MGRKAIKYAPVSKADCKTERALYDAIEHARDTFFSILSFNRSNWGAAVCDELRGCVECNFYMSDRALMLTLPDGAYKYKGLVIITNLLAGAGVLLCPLGRYAIK